MNEQGKRGQAWLERLLKSMGVAAPVVAREPDAEGAVWLEIAAEALDPAQVDLLLGERGHTIDAIQYLANTLLNVGHGPEEQQAFTVELAGYRRRRQAELAELVTAAIAQVRATGAEVEMEHLSAAERRQVHNLLKDQEDLTTESRGAEPDRRLFICRR